MSVPTSEPTGFKEHAKQSALYPQESLDPLVQDKRSLLIGIPREVSLQENRVALTPEGVAILTRNGHRVWVEKEAGMGAHFTDNEDSEAGAQLYESASEVFNADLILKVEPLLEKEIE